MNKVIMMGRLSKNPEIRYGKDGLKVASYALAINRKINQGVDFFQCIVIGGNAEVAEKYLKKGMKILVTGRLQTSSYTNQEGNIVHSVSIFVEDQEFTEKKEKYSGEKTETYYELSKEEEQEIPFL